MGPPQGSVKAGPVKAGLFQIFLGLRVGLKADADNYCTDTRSCVAFNIVFLAHHVWWWYTFVYGHIRVWSHIQHVFFVRHNCSHYWLYQNQPIRLFLSSDYNMTRTGNTLKTLHTGTVYACYLFSQPWPVWRLRSAARSSDYDWSHVCLEVMARPQLLRLPLSLYLRHWASRFHSGRQRPSLSFSLRHASQTYLSDNTDICIYYRLLFLVSIFTFKLEECHLRHTVATSYSLCPVWWSHETFNMKKDAWLGTKHVRRQETFD